MLHYCEILFFWKVAIYGEYISLVWILLLIVSIRRFLVLTNKYVSNKCENSLASCQKIILILCVCQFMKLFIHNLIHHYWHFTVNNNKILKSKVYIHLCRTNGRTHNANTLALLFEENKTTRTHKRTQRKYDAFCGVVISKGITANSHPFLAPRKSYQISLSSMIIKVFVDINYPA